MKEISSVVPDEHKCGLCEGVPCVIDASAPDACAGCATESSSRDWCCFSPKTPVPSQKNKKGKGKVKVVSKKTPEEVKAIFDNLLELDDGARAERRSAARIALWKLEENVKWAKKDALSGHDWYAWLRPKGGFGGDPEKGPDDEVNGDGPAADNVKEDGTVEDETTENVARVSDSPTSSAGEGGRRTEKGMVEQAVIDAINKSVEYTTKANDRHGGSNSGSEFAVTLLSPTDATYDKRYKKPVSEPGPQSPKQQFDVFVPLKDAEDYIHSRAVARHVSWVRPFQFVLVPHRLQPPSSLTSAFLRRIEVIRRPALVVLIGIDECTGCGSDDECGGHGPARSDLDVCEPSDAEYGKFQKGNKMIRIPPALYRALLPCNYCADHDRECILDEVPVFEGGLDIGAMRCLACKGGVDPTKCCKRPTCHWDALEGHPDFDDLIKVIDLGPVVGSA